jgi:hypothetical protein
VPLSAPTRTNLGPFGPPGRPRGPLPPSNCAKIAPPPCAAGGGGVSRIPSGGRGRIAASPHLLFMCVLGPLSFRSSLYQLVLTRSRCPQLPTANHLLAYLVLLAGPEALSRPATAQNSPPPLRRCAQPEAQKKAPPSVGDRGQPQSMSTALKIPQKVPCRIFLPL